MYKLINKVTGQALDTVCRLSDGAVIPFALDNTDYQAYLKWLEEGNVPESAE